MFLTEHKSLNNSTLYSRGSGIFCLLSFSLSLTLYEFFHFREIEVNRTSHERISIITLRSFILQFTNNSVFRNFINKYYYRSLFFKRERIFSKDIVNSLQLKLSWSHFYLNYSRDGKNSVNMYIISIFKF